MTTRKSSRVQIKRAYEAPASGDGQRVLIDRMWPRGVTHEKLALDGWLKDAAPSAALRRWFDHDPDRWREFVARYRDELRRPPASEAMAELVRRARQGPLTLVYGARDETHNNAVALRDVVGQLLSRHGGARTPARRP